MMADRQVSEEAMETARGELQRTVMAAFCKTLHGGDLAPIVVLGLIAEAVGAAYREVADAHRGDNACPCPWRPDAEADIALLQNALAEVAAAADLMDLRFVAIAGRA